VPYLYKSPKTKTDPASGKRVPVRNKKGEIVYHDKWRFQYIHYSGKRRTGTGYTSKAATLKLANEVEAEHRLIREGYKPVPKSKSKHLKRPIKEVKDEYLAWGRKPGTGRGGFAWSETHALKKEKHLDWWVEELGLETLADLEGTTIKVKTKLSELQVGRSAKTVKNVLEAIKGFVNWTIAQGYIENDPLVSVNVDKNSVATSPGRERRAVTREELQKLLKAAPEHRRLAYEVAFCTGLRVRELRLLEVSDLSPDLAHLILRPEITKNRKPGMHPIPRSLGERLGDYIASGTAKALYEKFYVRRDHNGKDIPDNPLLYVPSHAARDMDVDLRAAQIPKFIPGKGKIDFHALRVAYVSYVLESGASVKEAQTLARHSDPRLTLNVYAKASNKRLSELSEGIGDLVHSAQDSDEEYITGPERAAAGCESFCDSGGLVVEDRGFEPPTSALRTRRSPS